MARVFLGLGSNLGDRSARIFGGLRGCVDHGMRLAALSPLYESAAVGGPSGQPNYLNAVAILETGLEPMVVLRILQAIEDREGARPLRSETPRGPSTSICCSTARRSARFRVSWSRTRASTRGSSSCAPLPTWRPTR